MDVLLIDEITHLTETMYRFLRGRLRQVGLEIPEHFEQQYTGMFPRIMVSGNPGNIGHLWVKKAWIAGKIKGRDILCGRRLMTPPHVSSKARHERGSGSPCRRGCHPVA
jgi:hypothetical protein